MSTILVTGSAGFIGYHFCEKLIACGHSVVGIDNLNDYYDVSLKVSRNDLLRKHDRYTFVHADIADKPAMEAVFSEYQFEYVVNLAAQAGVRYSLDNPDSYINSNIVGFMNVLEMCRHHKVKHLVYASSSSVYGANTEYPLSESQPVDHPLSLYAATKRSNELMAHTYSSLYNLPATGLRFFTVYGPWGRPDMALFKFVKNILEEKPIDVYNNGEMLRDFTYVTDIVEGIYSVMLVTPKKDDDWLKKIKKTNTSYAPWRLFNIGKGSPVSLLEFVRQIESALGKKAVLNLMPMQMGDVAKTFADTSTLFSATGYSPKVDTCEGISSFVTWYLEYYGVKETA